MPKSTLWNFEATNSSVASEGAIAWFDTEHDHTQCKCNLKINVAQRSYSEPFPLFSTFSNGNKNSTNVNCCQPNEKFVEPQSEEMDKYMALMHVVYTPDLHEFNLFA